MPAPVGSGGVKSWPCSVNAPSSEANVTVVGCTSGGAQPGLLTASLVSWRAVRGAVGGVRDASDGGGVRDASDGGGVRDASDGGGVRDASDGGGVRDASAGGERLGGCQGAFHTAAGASQLLCSQ
eukprot:859192-Prymnesium_polylepis.1